MNKKYLLNVFLISVLFPIWIPTLIVLKGICIAWNLGGFEISVNYIDKGK